MDKTETVIAYADWLNGMEWNTFATFTTRYPLTVKSARRAMERLHSNLTDNYGETRLFWVAEPFDTKNGYHTHGLVHLTNSVDGNINNLLRKSWQIVSKGAGGKEYNNTILKPYEPDLGAHFYVSKYMFKKYADWDIY